MTRADVEAAQVVVRPYANKSELQHFPNAKIGAYASNNEAQAKYILSGHFLGYLPDHMTVMFRKADRLKALLVPEAQIRSAFVIIAPKHKKASLSQRIFVTELRKRAGNAEKAPAKERAAAPGAAKPAPKIRSA